MSELRITKTGVGFLIDASAKTYETVEKQLREFISNSVDAGATRVRIEVVPSSRTLVVTDNGDGMTEEEFNRNYLVIGCSEKYGDKDTIGRIGVGKFSAIPLCDRLTIRTRKKGTERVYAAELDLGQLREPGNRTTDISKLVLGEGNYVEPSVDDPSSEFSPDGGFTRMVLKSIPDEVIRTFTNDESFEDLRRSLGRILPLEYNESSVALEKLGRIDPELVEELVTTARQKSIQVQIITPEDPDGIVLYRSLFGDDFDRRGEQICGDPWPIDSPKDTSPAPIKIIGYLADMTSGGAENLPWKGLNVRLQNTTVVQNDFFDYDDAPAQNRITGEIQILNVNEEELITMNRSGFVTGFDEYGVISQWLTTQLADFGRQVVRKRTNFNSEMNKKSNELKNRYVASEKLEKAIREVFEEDNIDVDLSLLSKGELSKDDEINQEEALLRQYSDEVVEIIPVPPTTTEKIIAEPVGGKFSLTVPETFLDYFVEIDGEQFEVKYVEHDQDEPIIDVDVEAKTIRVNGSSPPVRKGNAPLLLALILIEYTFAAFPTDPVMLKKKIFEAIMAAFRS